MGIPTVTITRQDFTGVVGNAFAGKDFSAEAAGVEYPIDMFVPGSDLTPVEKKLDDLITGLTAWKPEIKDKKVIKPPNLMVTGKDYEDAVANMNRLFLKNMWGDGLPILPPTRERVKWLLTGTDLSPDKVIARMLPRGGITTVETIAVNLAMAGGRPEYLPVLIAAVEAIAAPRFQHHRMNSTTCSVYPVVIVNGPAAKQVRLNSGYGCLGPDPLHPAGASIGRALRFLLQAAGGAVPGKGTMSIFGGPARYNNIVFAEDEDGLPAGWKALSVEQGFPSGSNTVTAYSVAGTVNILGGEATDQKLAIEAMNLAAAVMAVPSGNYWLQAFNPDGAAGILLMARGTARGLAALGYAKEDVKAYLWENSKVPAAKAARWIQRAVKQDPLPLSMSPGGIKIAVTGGLQSGHMMWLEVGCCAEQLTSAKIEIPAGWNELLKKAEADLGPLPPD